MTTLIRGSYVIGFEDGDHVVYPDAEVVIEGDEIRYVGAEFDSDVDRVLDGEYLVMPGLIDLNARLNPGRDDTSRGGEESQSRLPDQRDSSSSKGDVDAIATYAVSTLLRSGTTTLAATGTLAPDEFASSQRELEVYENVVRRVGARAYLGHRYRSAISTADSPTGTTSDSPPPGLYWNPERGRAGFELACHYVEELAETDGNRVQALLAPDAPETVTRELLADTREAAVEEHLPVSTRFFGSETAVDRFAQRHDVAPAEYLADLELLSPDVWLIHGRFLDGNPDGRTVPSEASLERIGKSEATVIHCPVVEYQRGTVLRSFTRYGEYDVTMALGTGTEPRPLTEAMRWGSLANKWAENDPAAGGARELFTAATLGGAQTLGRDDLGRLEPGAKADIVCVDLSSGHVGPVYDPIRSLIYTVTPTDVQYVFVGGDQVVDDGTIGGVDRSRILERARAVRNRNSHRQQS